MNQKLLKSHTILAICILILSIIPVVAIGPYLHQFADDYVFGAPVYKAWTATHSFGACIQAAWAESMHIYQTWQGTYSACFLMALQPGIFGKYWLVPIILLGSLILSTYTLGYTILRRLLHISKLEYTFISTLFVLMTVQFVWSFYDAFCWYNGAMYYTLYYSISLATTLMPSTPRVCSKWELWLPTLFSRKPKPTSLRFLCLLTAPIRKAHCCVLAVG